MATTTPNYGLGKPLISEKYDVNVFNANTDKIDSELKKVVDRVEAIITTPAGGGISAQEVIDARQGEASLGANINKLTSQLAQKAQKDDVQNDLNKKRDKVSPITLNDLDTEALAAIQGGEGTAFNIESIPRPYSVDAGKTTFATSKNKFNGIYTKNLGLAGETAIGFKFASRVGAISVVFKGEKGKTYTISKSNDTDLYGIATNIGEPVLDNFATRAVNNNTETWTTKTVTLQGEEDRIFLYLSSTTQGKEPSWLQIEEGTVATSYTSPNAVAVNFESKSIKTEFLGDKVVNYTKTNFLKYDPILNLFDGNYSNKRIAGTSPNYSLATGTTGINKTAIISIKPNTTYSIIKDPSDIFKLGTDNILDRGTGILEGSVERILDTPDKVTNYTFTSGASDVVLYVYASALGQDVFMQVVEGEQTDFTIYREEPIVPSGVFIYSKAEVNDLIENIEINERKLLVKKTGESLTIRIPTKNNQYVQYIYKHVVNSTTKYDSWRIYTLEIVDSKFNSLWLLADNIEMEGAIEEVGAVDFIGGFHGDEYMIDISIMLDGTEIPTNEPDFEKYVDEVRIVNRSYLNHAETTTRVFTRYRVNTWNKKEGLVVENKYITDDSININKTHLTMIGVNKVYNGKQQIKWARTNHDYEKVDVSVNFNGTSLSTTRNDTTVMEMWGEESDIYIKVESKYDKVKYSKQSSWIYDFGDRPKIYFDATGQAALNVGDTIECTSIYTIC